MFAAAALVLLPALFDLPIGERLPQIPASGTTAVLGSAGIAGIARDGTLSDAQIVTHQDAARRLNLILEETLAEATRRLKAGEPLYERDLQEFVEKAYARDGLVVESRPVIAVNVNSSNPAYETSGNTNIKKGDVLLLNLTAKKNVPGAVYADVTWMAFAGRRAEIPPRVARVWEMVRLSRDRTLALLMKRVAAKKGISGDELDEAARKPIRKEKHEASFLHAAGHSLGETPFGSGANLKRGEARLIVSGTCFAIEPGVYYSAEFGVRSEIDVCVRGEAVEISGVPQREIRALLE